MHFSVKTGNGALQSLLLWSYFFLLLPSLLLNPSLLLPLLPPLQDTLEEDHQQVPDTGQVQSLPGSCQEEERRQCDCESDACPQ